MNNEFKQFFIELALIIAKCNNIGCFLGLGELQMDRILEKIKSSEQEPVCIIPRAIGSIEWSEALLKLFQQLISGLGREAEWEDIIFDEAIEALSFAISCCKKREYFRLNSNLNGRYPSDDLFYKHSAILVIIKKETTS